MRHTRGRLTVLMLVLAVASLAAPTSMLGASGAGWLDPTFGSGGYVSVPKGLDGRFGCGHTIDLAVAPTGRIFTAALYCDADGDIVPSVVVAFTTAGRLDPAFNGGRPLRAAIANPTTGAVLTRVFGTPSGGLITYVIDSPDPCDRATRYGPTGARDTRYGRGCLPTPTFEYGRGVATILPGRSLRTCMSDRFPGTQVSLTGLTPDGILDQRIGPDGYRVMPIQFHCWAFTSDAGGRLYWVSRRSLPDGRAVIEVRRTTHTGDLDTAWGDGGLATVELAGQHLKPVTAVAGPDGSLLIGLGISDSPTNASWRAGVARVTPAGSVDVAFGTDGVRRYVPPETNASRLEAVTVDSVGRPIVSVSVPTGRPYPGPSKTGYLTRGRASDGAPDATFGVNGWVTLSRPIVELAMAGPSRILALSDVRNGLVLSARRN